MQPHGLTASQEDWSFNNCCKYPRKKISLIWTCDRVVSLIFLHREVLWVKRIVLANGWRLTQSDHTVRPRFQNHVYRLFKDFFNTFWFGASRALILKAFVFVFLIYFILFYFFWVCLFAKNPTTNIHGFKSNNFVGVPWWEGLDSAMGKVRLIGSLSMEEERLQI